MATKSSKSPGRDASGRWLPGTCGNPLGRPKKRRFDRADLYVFGQTQAKVGINGTEIMMTRREAMLLKLYEAAIKGDTRASIYLHKCYAKLDEQRARCELRLEELMQKWVFDRPPGQPMPLEVEGELMELQTILFLDPNYLTFLNKRGK